MNADIFIVACIVIAALIYIVVYFVRKTRRLSKNVGPCGHCCDNCPFAKTNQGGTCCHSKPVDKI